MITISIHSTNVTYQPQLSDYLSKEYHGTYKVKDKPTRTNQILIDLFSHSQRVYFKNRYYIQTAHYPAFEAWRDYIDHQWHASYRQAKIYNVVFCNPAQHSWGYLITIPVKPHLINHDIIKQTKKIAQQMLDDYSQKPIRMHHVKDLFLYRDQLFITITKP